MASMDAQTLPGRVRWSRYIRKSQRKRPAKCWPFFGLNFCAAEPVVTYVKARSGDRHAHIDNVVIRRYKYVLTALSIGA